MITTNLFPDPRCASPEGIVAFGADLRPATLLGAYRQGIFPWPIEGYPLPWFCPGKRAILEFERMHIPRSLARERRKSQWRLSIDEDFAGVIELCANVAREGEAGTWITDGMIAAYLRLHRLGFAHSVEVWDGVRLIGGLYGVDADGSFAGESMFHRAPNASKFALLHLVEHLAARGATWIDIQTLTPHMETFGAREISRDEFLDLLLATRRIGLRLFDGVSREASARHVEG